MPDPIQVETTDRASVFNAESGKWFDAWQTVFRPFARYAAINLSTLGNHIIIAGDPISRVKIVSLFFTVADDVNLTMLDGALPISGPMDFGGAGLPRGMCIPFPFTPLELTKGSAFIINLSAAVQVSGTVCYFYQ